MVLSSQFRQMERRAATAGGFLRSLIPVLVLFVCAAGWSTPAYANASVFVNSSVASCVYSFCTAASKYGLLVGLNDTVTMAGNAGINILNDIGMDNGAKISVTNTSGVNVGSSTQADVIDFSDSMTNSGAPCTGNTNCTHPTGTTFSSSTKVWGGTKLNSSLVDTAITQVGGLVTYWTGQSATVLNASNYTLTGNFNVAATAGAKVYSVGGNLTAGTSDVVIGCGASACDPTALIVILVSGTINISRAITFAANSQLTDDQLLFITTSTSATAMTIGANATRAYHGDYFAPNGGFVLGNSGGNSLNTIWGRVFAGTSAAAVADTINRGVTIQDMPEVPEPGTWAMMGGGLAAMIYAIRRKRAA